MEISVIIPAYNRAGTIERSIRSVLDQWEADLELIVVDDCSTDQTEAVVRGIGDARVRYTRLDRNSGACVARNRGIELAEGDWIAFQDSDDVWKPNKLAVQMEALRQTGADICSCRLRRHYVGENARVILWPQVEGLADGFLDHRQVCRRSWISTQTILARREVFARHKFDPLVVKGQDYDWSIRASRDCRIYFLAADLVDQYLQKDSITLGGARKIVESRQYFLQKYRDELEEDAAFKLYLLRQIAHNKVLCGMDPAQEYGEIFRLDKTPHNLLCAALSRARLIKWVVRS